MNRYDILEAMGGIRDEYIEEAGIPLPEKEEMPEKEQKTVKPGRVTGTGRRRILHLQRWGATAAALLCVCVIAFAVRSGLGTSRVSESTSAEQGMISMAEEEVKVEDGNVQEDSVRDAGSYAYDAQPAAGGMETMGEGAAVVDDGDGAKTALAEEEAQADVSLASAMTDAGVSGAVRQMTEEEVRVFENSLTEETGYSSLRFTHEVTTDSADWFSLRMKAYTCAADGFEQVTHFNINRDSSQYVTLETLFSEDTDYITPLSKEVIRQMREQMAADPDTEYWLDSVEGPAYDFQEISPAQDFYFDKNGNLVLCFNEGEAAPTYMGTVEFTIPRSITDKLFKNSI